MPANTRQWAKRKFDEAKNNLDWAIHHLGEVIEVYDAEHPEVSKPTQSAVAAIVELQNYLERIKGSF